MFCVEKLIGTVSTAIKEVQQNENIKGYLFYFAIAAAVLWAVLSTGSDIDNIGRGFGDTRAELSDAGSSAGAIADGIGRSEGIATGLDAGIDRIGGSAGRVEDGVDRAKNRIIEAKDGAGGVEARIVAAENRVGKAIQLADESRAILEGYRKEVSEGAQEAGKKN